MGQPVVHFEVIGKDGAKLQSYYSELFGWQIDTDNPMGYGMVQREGNTNADGVGIGGGVGVGPEGYEGHGPSTWRYPTSRPRWRGQRSWAARG
jgi:uncharacterized protein